ncbi:hypothetical protein ACLMJK_006482 [Lecanora helva]
MVSQITRSREGYIDPHTMASPYAGITIKTASHGANMLSSHLCDEPMKNDESLLKTSCRNEFSKCKEILQSSFQMNPDKPHFSLGTNGFVKGALGAYSHHHHLIIRPEDVWFAILTQFSCYVNAHAEELRGKFVAHKGKKKLEIKMVGTRYTVDFGWFAEEMGRLLEKNVVDAELREWIIPSFSTTTRDDTVVGSIIMMGTLQKYFEYSFCLLCGLPSVTLLGTVEDWKSILTRAEKLKMYGEETTLWYNMLEPVLSRFVRTFQSPDSDEVLDFWQKIAHRRSGGSGPEYLSGWITVFCFWDEEGRCLCSKPGHLRMNPAYLQLDDAVYHWVEMDSVPPGYGSVPVNVDDNGHEFEATMVAGSVAVKGTSSGKPTEDGQVGLDTLQPVTGWWMFENTKDADEEWEVGS